MINLVRTRLHDRNSGAVTGGVHQLEFRGSEIMVLSLELENAASMSDLEFELVPGEFNIDNGAVRYDRGLSFEKKDRLARSFTSLNPSVLLRNVSPYRFGISIPSGRPVTIAGVVWKFLLQVEVQSCGGVPQSE